MSLAHATIRVALDVDLAPGAVGLALLPVGGALAAYLDAAPALRCDNGQVIQRVVITGMDVSNPPAAPGTYERRYLGSKPQVAHTVAVRGLYGHAVSALCGTTPAWFDSAGWRGTGSQEEYEIAAQLRDCKRCVRILGGPVSRA